MPKILLNVPFHRQQTDGDCLAACAQMILGYLGKEVSYPSLLHLLEIKPYGAPAGNIRYLSKLGIEVTYSVTNVKGLKAHLAKGQPVVVFVRTGELPYWEYDAAHALVVAGYDEGYLFVQDPYYGEGDTIAIARGDFELAWLERDYYYAVLRIVEQ